MKTSVQKYVAMLRKWHAIQKKLHAKDKGLAVAGVCNLTRTMQRNGQIDKSQAKAIHIWAHSWN